jgi:hypothetical protein
VGLPRPERQRRGLSVNEALGDERLSPAIFRGIVADQIGAVCAGVHESLHHRWAADDAGLETGC